MNNPRRTFLMTIAASGAAIATGAQAQAQARLDEKEPQAVALGYVNDAARADAKRFPKYAPGQNCANCSLYQAKPTDPWGPCPLFANKQVAAKAWCSAWVKRA
ncbi:MAG TPA: high-potential iron-sulfur protein [Caldimonas sp.]|jgi:hypothetical protein|nr:high-potential iron-sulfur protein [Caldimonas sp.]HEX2540325.1 high-potential iron-sulfur protein [Caldimonas sp.]